MTVREYWKARNAEKSKYPSLYITVTKEQVDGRIDIRGIIMEHISLPSHSFGYWLSKRLDDRVTSSNSVRSVSEPGRYRIWIKKH